MKPINYFVFMGLGSWMQVFGFIWLLGGDCTLANLICGLITGFVGMVLFMASGICWLDQSRKFENLDVDKNRENVCSK